MGKADAFVQEGCYRCLEDALDIYARVAASPGNQTAQRRAFETAVLLTVRAKELGLPDEAFMARARTLAASIEPVASPLLPPSAYLGATELFVGEVSGMDPELRQDRARRMRANRPADGAPPAARTALDSALPTDIVAQYLALAIDCEDTRARAPRDFDDVLARHGAIPLMRYRVALCSSVTARLGQVREGDTRWVDTRFFEGRREMTTRPVADVAKAVEHFAAARVAFPESAAITMALGTAQNALSQYDAALASFDSVLANEPTHRDALLGRVMSLSYLNRHPEAVGSATQMIELGTWHVGDAYYWRAWNQYQLGNLEPAWIDIEASTKLQVNTTVYTLAGFIAYAQKELATAVDRFDRAFKMDNTNCEAVWSAGLVHVDQQAWEPAAPKFARAMSCFTSAAAQAHREIAEAEQATYAETVRARRIAAAQKRVDTAEHRKAQAAFNAAGSYLRLGEKGSALHHVDVAAEHPLLKEKAAALRVTIDKLPS